MEAKTVKQAIPMGDVFSDPVESMVILQVTNDNIELDAYNKQIIIRGIETKYPSGEIISRELSGWMGENGMAGYQTELEDEILSLIRKRQLIYLLADSIK